MQCIEVRPLHVVVLRGKPVRNRRCPATVTGTKVTDATGRIVWEGVASRISREPGYRGCM